MVTYRRVIKIMSEKEQSGDMLADFHGIVMGWKNSFSRQHSCNWSI